MSLLLREGSVVPPRLRQTLNLCSFVRRGHELTVQRAARMMVIAARLLMCWVVYLAFTLAASEHRSHWIVLDVLEIIVLLVIAKGLLQGRRRRVAITAFFAAPMFLYDAGIDITSSHREIVELVIASMMAVLVELPLSAAMFLLAVRCAFHRTPHRIHGVQPR